MELERLKEFLLTPSDATGFNAEYAVLRLRRGNAFIEDLTREELGEAIDDIITRDHLGDLNPADEVLLGILLGMSGAPSKAVCSKKG